MQRDTEIAEDFLTLWVDIIEENHKTMVANTAGIAQRVDEIDFALTVGGEIFHQQHALTRNQQALDLCTAAEAFRLLLPEFTFF